MEVSNLAYNSIASYNDVLYVDDWPFHLSGSVDSNVATIQVPVGFTLALEAGDYSFLPNIQRWPGVQAAYVQLNSFQIGTRQLSADSIQTVLQIDYVDPGTDVHPLLLYDSRTFTPVPVALYRLFPMPLIDPGLQNIGGFQATVLATSAVAAHPVTYDIIASFQIIYTERDPKYQREVARALDDMKKEQGEHRGVLRGILGTLEKFIPGNEEVAASNGKQSTS